MVAVTETESQELGDTSGTATGLLGQACATYWREVGSAGMVCGSPACALQGPGTLGGSLSGSTSTPRCCRRDLKRAERSGAGRGRVARVGLAGEDDRGPARTSLTESWREQPGTPLRGLGRGPRQGLGSPSVCVLAGVGGDLGFLLSAVGLGTLFFFSSPSLHRAGQRVR